MRFPLVTRRRHERDIAWWRDAHDHGHRCWAVEFRNAWRFKRALTDIRDGPHATSARLRAAEALDAEEYR